MLKTNKFKTLVVLLTTILGLTGITSTVYADKASDKKTINNMALQFVRYSTVTTGNALDWAEHNTTGKAYADPYRFGAKNKNRAVVANNETLGAVELPSESSTSNSFKISVLQTKFTSAKTAFVIVSRYMKDTRMNTRKEFWYKHKIWFKKINNKWKISDYYTLLTKEKINNSTDNIGNHAAHEDDNLANTTKGNPWGYDSKGSKFPR